MTVTFLPATGQVHDEASRENFEYIESHGVFDSFVAKKHREAALVLVANTWTPVPLDTTVAGDDPNGLFSGGNYVCPADGFYHIDGELDYTIGSPQTGVIVIETAVWKNNVIGTGGLQGSSSPITNQMGSNQNWGTSVNGIITAKKGDLITLYGFCTAGVGITAAAGADFVGYLHVFKVG